MDTLMALQNLAVTVHGLKESIEITAKRVSSISNTNNNASQYHATFSELLSKYSGFAVNYKFELDNLHKSLLNDINLQQKERERAEREFQEKLESLSNKSTHSNLEIDENVEATDYHSSAYSVNNMSNIAPNSPSHNGSETNTVSMDIPTSPQEMKSKKSVPVSPKSKPAPTPQRKTKANHKNNTKKSSRSTPVSAPKSKVSSRAQTKPKTKKASIPSEPLFVRTVTADIEKKEQQQEQPQQEQKNEVAEDKYVYRADKIRFAQKFSFKHKDEKTGEVKDIDYRHTTMVYIGNIPSNIKVAAVQFFVMKKFKVTMRQVEETKLMKGRGFTQYALVRFRSDVGLDKITKCMEMVNSENAQIKEERKRAKDTMHSTMKKTKTDKAASSNGKSGKKKLRTSWQTRVFIKFQDPEYHFSYYETEKDMYEDRRAKHSLFIRNFDILDKKCHKQLTDTLLQFGDLVKDINIRLDAFNDPFCVVIFKYLNEAIYCCNSDVYFNGRRLEMRYSKF